MRRDHAVIAFSIFTIPLLADADSFQCTKGASADGGVCAAGSREVEEASLLQRRGFERAKKRHKLRRALGLQGGGHRSMSSFAGLAAGLLACVGGGGFEALFRDVDIFASNSGGTWYNAANLYSERIKDMQQEMAKHPTQAAAIYNRIYTSPLLAHFGEIVNDPNFTFSPMNCSDVPETAKSLSEVRAGRGSNSSQSGYVPAGFWYNLILNSNGATASTVTEEVMSPSGIPVEAPLSYKPNSWAEGKLLLVCASAPTPGSPDGANQSVFVDVEQDPETHSPEAISYQAKTNTTGATFPAFLPVKFTFRLGGAPEADAPFPFCGREDCFGLFFKYTAETEIRGPRGSVDHSASSAPLGQIVRSLYQERAGMLDLFSVITTSNSDPTATTLARKDKIQGYFREFVRHKADCADLAIWANEVPFGRSFPSAARQRDALSNAKTTDASLKATASSGLHTLIDGAHTDNTGVANSIAVMTSAAQQPCRLNAIAWLNGPDNPPGGPRDIFAAPTSLYQLFPGASLDERAIFSSPTYEEVVVQVKQLASVSPRFPARSLHKLIYGTIRNCTTAENKWWGTKAGFTVDIHIFWVLTSMTAGSMESFYQYGDLAGETTRTMAEEASALLPFVQEAFRL